jgi:hypothetical protein
MHIGYFVLPAPRISQNELFLGLSRANVVRTLEGKHSHGRDQQWEKLFMVIFFCSVWQAPKLASISP